MLRRRSSAKSRCMRQAVLRLPCCGDEWRNTNYGMLSGNGRPRDARSRSEERDLWWISSDDTEKLTWMVNAMIEELLDLDMEPKPESMWWTSTYEDEDREDAECENHCV